MEITSELAQKVLNLVDQGLVKGLGIPKPGKMCVEAAVCYALGEPHSDNPSCVSPAVRRFKIRLNDAPWPSNEARTRGMRKLAIAQLGSESVVDDSQFTDYVVEQTIKRLIPVLFREIAPIYPTQTEAMLAAADRCEREGTLEAALNARYAADAAHAAAAAHAAHAAAYAHAAYAYAYAAAAAHAAAAYAGGEKCLLLSAEIALEALKLCKSPGCEFLYLVGE